MMSNEGIESSAKLIIGGYDLDTPTGRSGMSLTLGVYTAFLHNLLYEPSNL
jgi:hypothetical protein